MRQQGRRLKELLALLSVVRLSQKAPSSPHILTDRFSGTNVLTGETTLIMNRSVSAVSRAIKDGRLEYTDHQ
tara:strand:+ start:112 stop:327 length:216 start_codon:yes stop_codon:yes gene_type:complete